MPSKGMPAAVRSQMKLMKLQAQAAKPVPLAQISQSQKNAMAELKFIRGQSNSVSLRLGHDVEAISLRTTATHPPIGVRRFQRHVWPQLIYANPEVRFGLELHYDRLSRAQRNEAIAREMVAIDERIKQLADLVEQIKASQVRLRADKAKLQGISLAEMETVSDTDIEERSQRIVDTQKQIEALNSQKDSLRATIEPLERIDRVGRIKDEKAAQEAAVEEALAATEGSTVESVATAQVIGPTTPKAVVEAVRSGKGTVDYPVRHALQVVFRPPRGLELFDLPIEQTVAPEAILKEAGLVELIARSSAKTSRQGASSAAAISAPAS